jgi:diguanylate cyclase (GGDEF)-like protein
MSLVTLNPEELPAILSQLDQAIYNHQQWFDALCRTLICRLPANRHDLSVEAHRECLLGQWYYNGGAPAKLHAHPGFIALGAEHEHMHRQATLLLEMARTGTTIDTANFDSFANSLQRVRLQILTLMREVEDLLRNADPLTGASNRTQMLSKLREQQELVKRGVHRCCVAMMDLDHFKGVNDTRGHLAGDRVLTAVAHYVIEHLRPYDRIFRFGGEEFLLCLLDSDLPRGQEMAERLRQGVAELSIDVGEGEPVRITASFGLTLLESGIPVEATIDHADKAMYAAKLAGRNQVRVWDASLE